LESNAASFTIALSHKFTGGLVTPQGMFNWILFNSLVLYLPLAAFLVWRKPKLWVQLLAFYLGIIIGWWDMQSTEASVAALLLVTFGFFCGFVQPKRAWLNAILLGIGIPVFAQLTAFFHLNPLTVVEQVTSLLALVFAFGGAYAGFFVRRLTHTNTELLETS
jgi:hypothetical protein